MAGTTRPTYGTPNLELITGWFALDPADDGPFWALNLMKYRAVADYSEAGDQAPDARATSGKEADDAYAPLGPLAAVGAVVAFHGDVLDQRGGEPAWDRVGIVRYPSRAAFFAMQQRDDFKDQHVHKEAGMEFTIVMSCLPDGPAEAATGDRTTFVVEPDGAAAAPLPETAQVLAELTVEGVIVGDDRRYGRVRVVAADDGAIATIAAGAADGTHVLTVARAIDRLAASINEIPGA